MAPTRYWDPWACVLRAMGDAPKNKENPDLQSLGSSCVLEWTAGLGGAPLNNLCSKEGPTRTAKFRAVHDVAPAFSAIMAIHPF